MISSLSKQALEKVDQEKPGDARKRNYNSLNTEVAVTEEEMEAYRLRKDRGDDPMAQISSEKLLDYK